MANSENKIPKTASAPKKNPKMGDKVLDGGANTRCDKILTFPTVGGDVVSIIDNPAFARYSANAYIYKSLPSAYEMIGGDASHLLVLPETAPTNYDVAAAMCAIMEMHITRFFIDAIVNCLDYNHCDCGCECDDEPTDEEELRAIYEYFRNRDNANRQDHSSDSEDENFDTLKVGTVEQPAPVMFTNCHIGNLYINEKKAKNKGGAVDQSVDESTNTEHNCCNSCDDDWDDDDDYPCSGDCAHCDGFSMCGEERPMSDSDRGNMIMNILGAIPVNITPERLEELKKILGYDQKKSAAEEDDE